MTLKLYFDLMSQPSRTLYILLKYLKYDFVPKAVDLRKGQHFTDEYSQVNRFQKVPVIDHNGFVLTESIAIMRYFSRENIVPESLYPKDSKTQARVDEYLEWQHIGLRLHTSMFFRVKYMNPILMGTKPDPKQVASYEKRMRSALEDFDSKWLGRGNKFITGDAITVADLLAACELEQPRMAGFDPKDDYANIAAWWQRVKDHFNPYYDEAHVILNKVVKKYCQTESKL